MQGRITEAQFPLAEKSFPGIRSVYDALDDKPATFLQLVFIYEEVCEVAALSGELEFVTGPVCN